MHFRAIEHFLVIVDAGSHGFYSQNQNRSIDLLDDISIMVLMAKMILTIRVVYIMALMAKMARVTMSEITHVTV